MGSGRNKPIKEDLFSARQSPDSSLQSTSKPIPPLRQDNPTSATSPSYALPTNLPNALSHLDNDQLDRLIAAALSERQGRGGKMVSPPEKPSRKPRIKTEAAPLPQGKLNAVRAAFKAGVTPNRIAKQYGISQSDVRRALAVDDGK